MRRFLFSADEKMLVYDLDVVIIGSGIAGLYTSLHIDPGLQCAIVTKNSIEQTNSYLAQGGIAAVVSGDDTYISHIDDTIRAGAGLCDPEAVKVLVEEGPDNIRTLIDMQIPFDVNPEGDLQITREGGHTTRRIVHCGGDATGKETTIQLNSLAMKRKNLNFFYDTYLIDIMIDDGGACGVVVCYKGEQRVIRSRNIIIAMGGCGQIYNYTTNPIGSVGEGIAAAYRAGAAVEDMEMIQFHPTALISEGKSERLFLISEAVRGEGAVLRNKNGDAFMKGKHEMADLAPRDIVTRCVMAELERTGDENVYLDVSSMSEEFFSGRFPTIYKECIKRGINVPKEMIPVRPAQHYLMGGVKTDCDGRTNIKGLFCCGETARTGIHGANRLASNSLLECLVFGRRSARYINSHIIPVFNDNKTVYLRGSDVAKTESAEFFAETSKRVKHLMSKYVGAVRTREGLAKAKKELDGIMSYLDELKLSGEEMFRVYSMAQVACLVTGSALERGESIGAHYIV